MTLKQLLMYYRRQVQSLTKDQWTADRLEAAWWAPSLSSQDLYLVLCAKKALSDRALDLGYAPEYLGQGQMTLLWLIDETLLGESR